MRTFIKGLLFFFIPLFCAAIVPVTLLKISSEGFTSVDNLLKSKERYLIGYAYHEDNYGYIKWTSIMSNEPRNIWALGSSRVLQFRANQFDSTFYNAGYTIYSINDFIPFLKSISKDRYPRYLILGLDQWMFNYAWDDLKNKRSEAFWKGNFIFFPEGESLQRVYVDLWHKKYGPFSFKQRQELRKVGLNAFINNKGILNDGSMFYGDQIHKLITKSPSAFDFQYKDTFSRINRGRQRFEFGNAINSAAVYELERLLKYCKSSHIEVIGFLPPFADSVYNRMVETGKYGYLNDLYREVSTVFRKYDNELYDFSNVSSVHSADKETLDGFHGSEVTYQRILIKMLESGSKLNRVTRIDRLKKDLDNRQNDYVVYPF